MMTPAGLTCPKCRRPLYPRLVRRTDDGYVCADPRACGKARVVAERHEDLDWMARTGETTWGAAERLGITHKALLKWCDRHDKELLVRLRGNEELRGVA